MYSRSNLIIRNVGALALTLTMLLSAGYSHTVRAATNTNLYITTLGDTNVEALFRDTYIADFAKAYPQYTVTYTNILHGTNAQELVVDNLTAAMATHQKSVPYDIFEDTPLNYTYPVGKTYKDYFQPLNAKNVPNAGKVDPAVLAAAAGYGIPYRGSSVVLAYNSLKVKNPPTTFDELISWIKANPGKFTYCDPNDGGSGALFVAGAIRSVMDPATYDKLDSTPYSKANEADWSKAWDLLKSIDGDMFQHGFHPNGNLPVLNLLARGTITVATVWSDQSLAALKTGLLPKYIKLVEINPPLPGSDTYLSVPKLAQNPAAARAFINFVLSPAEQAKMVVALSGFPAIQVKYMPPSIVKTIGSIDTGYDTHFVPGGLYYKDLEHLWSRNVPSGS